MTVCNYNALRMLPQIITVTILIAGIASVQCLPIDGRARRSETDSSPIVIPHLLLDNLHDDALYKVWSGAKGLVKDERLASEVKSA